MFTSPITDAIGKIMILSSLAAQFFWLTPLQTFQNDTKFENLDIRIQAVQGGLSTVLKNQKFAVNDPSKVVDEIPLPWTNNTEKVEVWSDSFERDQAIDRNEYKFDELSKLFFAIFFVGSVLVLICDVARQRVARLKS